MTITTSDRVAIVAGATGLVGRALVRALDGDRRWTRIVLVARRAVPDGGDGRVVTELVDFARLDEREVPSLPGGRVVAFCALGTTIKAAGSQAAFRAVDFDAALAFARYAKRAGASTLVLVSSVGADARARSFYLRVKGELEQAVDELGFDTLIILRPSLLLGSRDESRPGEALAQRLMPVTSPLLLGPLRRYRPVRAETVAAAMVAAAGVETPGRQVWEYDRIAAPSTTAARSLPSLSG